MALAPEQENLMRNFQELAAIALTKDGKLPDRYEVAVLACRMWVDMLTSFSDNKDRTINIDWRSFMAAKENG